MKNLYQDSISHQMYREALHWEDSWQWATNYCGELTDTKNVVSAIEEINNYREHGLEITEEEIVNILTYYGFRLTTWVSYWDAYRQERVLGRLASDLYD